MTIIKPSSEKKKTSQEKPLCENEALQQGAKNDVELGATVQVSRPAKRNMPLSSLMILLCSSALFACCVYLGYYMLELLQDKQPMTLLEILNVPYKDGNGRRPYYFDPARQSYNDQFNWGKEESDYFTERIEADTDYERIDVPNFHGGRRGRYVHDFKVNKTGIIDLDGNRCFVMPLDRTHILPPWDLPDLILKMRTGYYNVDTNVVRETMRVLVPPITNMEVLGKEIANECAGKRTYVLVKQTNPDNGISKRSAEESVVFGLFGGKNIMEFEITNLPEVEAFESR